MVELVWHWPGKTPEPDENSETQDGKPYWRDGDNPEEGAFYASTTPELIVVTEPTPAAA